MLSACPMPEDLSTVAAPRRLNRLNRQARDSHAWIPGASRVQTVPLHWGHPCWTQVLGYIGHSAISGPPPSRTKGCLAASPAPPRAPTAKERPLCGPCMPPPATWPAQYKRRAVFVPVFSFGYPQTPPLKTILPFPKPHLLHSPFLKSTHTLNPPPPTRTTPRQYFASPRPILRIPQLLSRIIRHHGRDPPKTRHRR